MLFQVSDRKSRPNNRRLKVLAFFVHKYRWGERIRGDERRFLELANEYKKAGLKLYVVEHTPSLQQVYHKQQVYNSLQIPSAHKSSLPGTFMQMFYTLLFAMRVCYKLRYKIDVIYSHNQDLSNLMLAYVAKLITKGPLIVVLQSLQDFRIPLSRLLRIYKASILDCLLILNHKMFGRLILKFTDFIFAASDTIRNDAMKCLEFKKIVVTGNGVDFNRFRPLRLDKEYDGVFLGRIDFAQKGMDILLKAWKVVIGKLPSAKLLVLGGFEGDHNRKLLMQLVEVLGLKNNVVAKGFVADDQLIELLNKSKVFVLPSRFEGFGLSVLEAMSCGLPCIVSDIPVFKELHQGIAVLVPQDNIGDFANEVLKILTNQATYDKISSTSRAHALKFPWSSVANKEMNSALSMRA